MVNRGVTRIFCGLACLVALASAGCGGGGGMPDAGVDAVDAAHLDGMEIDATDTLEDTGVTDTRADGAGADAFDAAGGDAQDAHSFDQGADAPEDTTDDTDRFDHGNDPGEDDTGAADTGAIDGFFDNGGDDAADSGGDDDAGDSGDDDGGDTGDPDTVADDLADQDTGPTACVPWVNDGGCGEGSWCVPDMYSAGTGICAASNPGGVGQGGECGTTEPCADGLICIDYECVAPCDPVATSGQPGSCAPVAGQYQGCAMIDAGESGIPVIGRCVQACVYDHARGQHETPIEPCPDGLACQPEFFRGEGVDYCVPYDPAIATPPLEPGARCPSGTEYSYCRPGGICLDLDEGNLYCHEICGPTPEHPFDSVDHPDCGDPAATCISLGTGSALGYCVPPPG